jgi:hypothetical protein
MQEEPMTRQLTKQIFGVPSTETASRIDDSDATNAACAATYRYHAGNHRAVLKFSEKSARDHSASSIFAIIASAFWRRSSIYASTAASRISLSKLRSSAFETTIATILR